MFVIVTHTGKPGVCRTVKFFHLFLSIPQISAQGRWIVIIRLPLHYIVPKVSARPVLHPSNKICEALDGGVTGSCACSWINKQIRNKHIYSYYIYYMYCILYKQVFTNNTYTCNAVFKCPSDLFNQGERENGIFFPIH